MKVAVLGAAGGIGQALALLLKTQLPSGSELSLYDIAPVTPGVAVDLSHIPTAVKIKGFSGEDATPALEGADVVLISAGVARKPGMDRSDLFNVNAGIVKNLVQQVAKTCPKACIGIITNPVNTTVAIAAEVLKKAGVYDKNKLFGVTTLDIIRSNTFVAELKGKQPGEVEVPVIGGHSGVTILPLLSQVPGVSFTEQEVADLAASAQEAICDVLSAKAVAAAKREGLPLIALVGGVAANRRLRELLAERAAVAGIRVCWPSPVYCTDNAAMIGIAALPKFAAGEFAALDLNAEPRLPL